jgi:nitrite reductase/ring-hydroxylating ferredoxin subunit
MRRDRRRTRKKNRRNVAVDIYIGKADEFAERDRRIVAVGDSEIGVFRVGGEFFAYENHCVHQGGPICQGQIRERVIEALAADKTSLGLRYDHGTLHLVCPWHGYEYDIKTGRHPGRRQARLKSYAVKLKGEDVYVVV